MTYDPRNPREPRPDILRRSDSEHERRGNARDRIRHAPVPRRDHLDDDQRRPQCRLDRYAARGAYEHPRRAQSARAANRPPSRGRPRTRRTRHHRRPDPRRSRERSRTPYARTASARTAKGPRGRGPLHARKSLQVKSRSRFSGPPAPSLHRGRKARKTAGADHLHAGLLLLLAEARDQRTGRRRHAAHRIGAADRGAGALPHALRIAGIGALACQIVQRRRHRRPMPLLFRRKLQSGPKPRNMTCGNGGARCGCACA